MARSSADSTKKIPDREKPRCPQSPPVSLPGPSGPVAGPLCPGEKDGALLRPGGRTGTRGDGRGPGGSVAAAYLCRGAGSGQGAPAAGAAAETGRTATGPAAPGSFFI